MTAWPSLSRSYGPNAWHAAQEKDISTRTQNKTRGQQQRTKSVARRAIGPTGHGDARHVKRKAAPWRRFSGRHGGGGGGGGGHLEEPDDIGAGHADAREPARELEGVDDAVLAAVEVAEELALLLALLLELARFSTF
jgi:hypothetical protein